MKLKVEAVLCFLIGMALSGIVSYGWIIFSGIVLGAGFKYPPVHEITIFNKIFRILAIPGGIFILIIGTVVSYRITKRMVRDALARKEEDQRVLDETAQP